MGQNSSTLASSGDNAANKNKTKPPRPPEPPKPPKIPNYVVPENKVIPNGPNDMEGARKLLRPVSQELSKFHPEFADIFHSSTEEEFLKRGLDDSSLERSFNSNMADKENNSLMGFSGTDAQLNNNLNTDPLARQNGSLMNGKAPIMNNQISSRSVGDMLMDGQLKESNLKRTHSLEKDRSGKQRIGGHKRQASFNSGQPVQQPAIPEDPREHLFNVARAEPFSNLIPGNASLPLKSSFQSDYSLNLTYAQLAEYRRQQREDELANKSDERLKQLGAEISATSTVPKSPFDRANLGANKASAPSVSTGSSENGVSKSKKKKAPPPPVPPKYEPPVDYDMEGIPLRVRNPITRSSSSVSRDSKRPAPLPSGKRMSVPCVNNNDIPVPSNANVGIAQPANVPPPVAPPAPPPPPPPPPAPPLPQSLSSKATPVLTRPTNPTGNSKANTSKIPGYLALKESVTGAKAQLEMLKKMKMDAMMKAAQKAESEKNAEAKQEGEEKENKTGGVVNESDLNNNSSGAADASSPSAGTGTSSEQKEEITIPLETTATPETGKGDEKSHLKRMNSLLQHDIILAAKSQAGKQRKAKTPPALEKPKDPAELFREELKKAALAREERRKEHFDFSDDGSKTPSTPDSDGEVLFRAKKVPLEKAAGDNGENINIVTTTPKSADLTQMENEFDSVPDMVRKGSGSDDLAQLSSAKFEKMSISSNGSDRRYSAAWIPEDDLEPDDDIMTGRSSQLNASTVSEGFKDSIVPMKIKDLKDKHGKKSNKNNKYEKRKEVANGISVDEKNKFGSIRRFRKSFHEGVKNAFGSLSRGSGKLMKKQKSQDILNGSDPSAQGLSSPYLVDLNLSGNWEFQREGPSNSMRRSRSEDLLRNSQINGHSIDEDGSGDEEDVGDIDFAAGIDDVGENRQVDENVLQNGDEEASPTRQMKRAGVAYVNSTGQIIVLPEYNTVNVDADGNEVGGNDDGGRAPKLFKKKDKKFTYESTLRQNERSRREDLIGREIRDKESQIERERIRQQTIEMDFLRLRDLDAQGRYQRIQTDSILQQLTMLQQQQVRQAHVDLNSNGTLSQPSVVAPPMNISSLMNGNPHVTNMLTHPNSLMSISNGPGQPLGYPYPTGHFNNGFGAAANTSHYASHSAPIIGGHVPHPPQPPHNTNPIHPNMSPQDLNTLTGYMNVMGVAPPVNQQQWSVLLNNVGFNGSGFPGAQGFPNGNQIPTTNPTNINMNNNNNNNNINNTASTNGPDLSNLFGINRSTNGTTVMNQNPTSQAQFFGIPNNTQQQNNIGSARLVEINPNSSISANATSTVFPQNPTPLQTNMSNTPTTTATTTTETTSNNTNNHHHIPAPSSGLPPVTNSVSSVAENNSLLANHSDTAEKRIDSLTSSGHHSLNGDVPQKTEDTINNANPNASTVHNTTILNGAPDDISSGLPLLPPPKTLNLPPKVYGPIGFKPVPFKLGAT